MLALQVPISWHEFVREVGPDGGPRCWSNNRVVLMFTDVQCFFFSKVLYSFQRLFSMVYHCCFDGSHWFLNGFPWFSMALKGF